MFKITGRTPSKADISNYSASLNFRDGAFQNLSPTPVMVDGGMDLKTIREMLFKPADNSPQSALPVVRSDLKTVGGSTPWINWFGHSSYLIRHSGLTILVDPVFSEHASPVPIFGKCFRGTSIYKAEDLPEIDLMIITHDHYDHMDYHTILKLKDRTTAYYVPLGLSSHLKYWGIATDKIHEFDWWDEYETKEFKLTAAPARHFTGRQLKRNQTLWASFILEIAGYRFYIGSDSGYDNHFKEIGERFGSFDLSFLECGQYNTKWRLIHMMPEQCALAGKELKSELVMPVHWGKFALANHSWYEPICRFKVATEKIGQQILVPKIGETVKLGKQYIQQEWWAVG